MNLKTGAKVVKLFEKNKTFFNKVAKIPRLQDSKMNLC